jgi:hypothetical protein
VGEIKVTRRSLTQAGKVEWWAVNSEPWQRAPAHDRPGPHGCGAENWQPAKHGHDEEEGNHCTTSTATACQDAAARGAVAVVGQGGRLELGS